jgi:hypothetical protein
LQKIAFKITLVNVQKQTLIDWISADKFLLYKVSFLALRIHMIAKLKEPVIASASAPNTTHFPF